MKIISKNVHILQIIHGLLIISRWSEPEIFVISVKKVEVKSTSSHFQMDYYFLL